MNRQSPGDVPRAFAVVLLLFIVVLFALRNLPWHLDDYDQAKQAFTSYEMINGGAWLFQHTPTGRIATKPPLAGWISAGIFALAGGRGWELAWRLPTFAAAALVLATLWRTGTRLFGGTTGGILAAGMFGLNFFTPRLATLVRTDMLLAAFIFFAGWLILEKVRTDTPWTRGERWSLFALVLGSLLTKGPIAYAFLAPGLVAFWLLTRRVSPSRAWAGWWCWLAPLALFIAWLALGLGYDPEFKEQVIYKEFLGRFTVGEGARHHNFPPGFYILNLLGKALPWSLLLPALFLARKVRTAVRQDRALLWLICWMLGGLLFMECVPSKRFDRIFPVVPPACLLLAAAARHLGAAWPSARLQRVAFASASIAAVLAGGYSLLKVATAFRENARALVAFGADVHAKVGGQQDRLAVVNGKDEAMLMYVGQGRFSSDDDALALWRAGRLDWVVLSRSDLSKMESAFEPFALRAEVARVPNKSNGYALIERLSARSD